MIEIKNLSKDYNGKQALDSINIVLPTNGLVSVIGNNGSGKQPYLEFYLQLYVLHLVWLSLIMLYMMKITIFT